MQCNPFIYTRSGTEILSRKYWVILRPTKTTIQPPGGRRGSECRVVQGAGSTSPTPDTGLLCYRGTADGGPTSCLGAEKAVFHHLLTVWMVQKAAPSQARFTAEVGTSGQSCTSCVSEFSEFSSISKIKIGRKSHLFSWMWTSAFY